MDTKDITNANFELLVKYNKNKGVNGITDQEYNELIEWSNKMDPKVNPVIKKTDYAYYAIILLIIVIFLLLILIFYSNIKPTTPTLDDLLNEDNKSYEMNVEEFDTEIIED